MMRVFATDGGRCREFGRLSNSDWESDCFHALEARLTWRFAWAMLLQTFAILGAVFAMLRLLA